MYDIELFWPTRHRGVRPESIEVRKSSIRPILVIQQASPTRMPETETTEFWSTMIVHGPFIDEMHTKNSCNRFRSRARGSGARARWFMHARMTKFWWICTGTLYHSAQVSGTVYPGSTAARAARVGRARPRTCRCVYTVYTHCTHCTHCTHTSRCRCYGPRSVDSPSLRRLVSFMSLFRKGVVLLLKKVTR